VVAGEEGKTPPGVDIAAVNLPASQISGDFYNWFSLPDGRVALAIGDVTGHGMGGGVFDGDDAAPGTHDDDADP